MSVFIKDFHINYLKKAYSRVLFSVLGYVGHSRVDWNPYNRRFCIFFFSYGSIVSKRTRDALNWYSNSFLNLNLSSLEFRKALQIISVISEKRGTQFLFVGNSHFKNKDFNDNIFNNDLNRTLFISNICFLPGWIPGSLSNLNIFANIHKNDLLDFNKNTSKNSFVSRLYFGLYNLRLNVRGESLGIKKFKFRKSNAFFPKPSAVIFLSTSGLNRWGLCEAANSGVLSVGLVDSDVIGFRGDFLIHTGTFFYNSLLFYFNVFCDAIQAAMYLNAEDELTNIIPTIKNNSGSTVALYDLSYLQKLNFFLKINRILLRRYESAFGKVISRIFFSIRNVHFRSNTIFLKTQLFNTHDLKWIDRWLSLRKKMQRVFKKHFNNILSFGNKVVPFVSLFYILAFKDKNFNQSFQFRHFAAALEETLTWKKSRGYFSNFLEWIRRSYKIRNYSFVGDQNNYRKLIHFKLAYNKFRWLSRISSNHILSSRKVSVRNKKFLKPRRKLLINPSNNLFGFNFGILPNAYLFFIGLYRRYKFKLSRRLYSKVINEIKSSFVKRKLTLPDKFPIPEILFKKRRLFRIKSSLKKFQGIHFSKGFSFGIFSKRKQHQRVFVNSFGGRFLRKDSIKNIFRDGNRFFKNILFSRNIFAGTHWVWVSFQRNNILNFIKTCKGEKNSLAFFNLCVLHNCGFYSGRVQRKYRLSIFKFFNKNMKHNEFDSIDTNTMSVLFIKYFAGLHNFYNSFLIDQFFFSDAYILLTNKLKIYSNSWSSVCAFGDTYRTDISFLSFAIYLFLSIGHSFSELFDKFFFNVRNIRNSYQQKLVVLCFNNFYNSLISDSLSYRKFSVENFIIIFNIFLYDFYIKLKSKFIFINFSNLARLPINLIFKTYYHRHFFRLKKSAILFSKKKLLSYTNKKLFWILNIISKRIKKAKSIKLPIKNNVITSNTISKKLPIIKRIKLFQFSKYFLTKTLNFFLHKRFFFIKRYHFISIRKRRRKKKLTPININKYNWSRLKRFTKKKHFIFLNFLRILRFLKISKNNKKVFFKLLQKLLSHNRGINLLLHESSIPLIQFISFFKWFYTLKLKIFPFLQMVRAARSFPNSFFFKQKFVRFREFYSRFYHRLLFLLNPSFFIMRKIDFLFRSRISKKRNLSIFDISISKFHKNILFNLRFKQHNLGQCFNYNILTFLRKGYFNYNFFFLKNNLIFKLHYNILAKIRIGFIGFSFVKNSVQKMDSKFALRRLWYFLKQPYRLYLSVCSSLQRKFFWKFLILLPYSFYFRFFKKPIKAFFSVKKFLLKKINTSNIFYERVIYSKTLSSFNKRYCPNLRIINLFLYNSFNVLNTSFLSDKYSFFKNSFNRNSFSNFFYLRCNGFWESVPRCSFEIPSIGGISSIFKGSIFTRILQRFSFESNSQLPFGSRPLLKFYKKFEKKYFFLFKGLKQRFFRKFGLLFGEDLFYKMIRFRFDLKYGDHFRLPKSSYINFDYSRRIFHRFVKKRGKIFENFSYFPKFNIPKLISSRRRLVSMADYYEFDALSCSNDKMLYDLVRNKELVLHNYRSYSWSFLLLRKLFISEDSLRSFCGLSVNKLNLKKFERWQRSRTHLKNFKKFFFGPFIARDFRNKNKFFGGLRETLPGGGIFNFIRFLFFSEKFVFSFIKKNIFFNKNCLYKFLFFFLKDSFFHKNSILSVNRFFQIRYRKFESFIGQQYINIKKKAIKFSNFPVSLHKLQNINMKSGNIRHLFLFTKTISLSNVYKRLISRLCN